MTFTQQRRYEILASNLLLGGCLVGLLANYFLKQGYWTKSLSVTSVLTVTVGFLVVFWQAYYIRKGRRWAKLLYVLLTIAGLFIIALDYKRTLVGKLDSPAIASNYIAQQLLALGVAVILLLSLRKPSIEPTQV